MVFWFDPGASAMRAVIDSLFELGAAKQQAAVPRNIRRVTLVPVLVPMEPS
jgi:hypothetical protein